MLDSPSRHLWPLCCWAVVECDALCRRSCACVSDFAEEHRVSAVRAGVIDAVLAAMMVHVDNAGVTEKACRALNLFCSNGKSAVYHVADFDVVFWVARCSENLTCSFLIHFNGF